eukprot:419103_1
MGSCFSSHKKVSNQSNSSIEKSLHPSQWNEQNIILWLQQSSNLSLLIKTFQKHKISGLTFANLSQDELQNELHITQFGLVKDFILLRDKLLSDYNCNKHEDISNTQTHSNNNKTPNTPSSTLHNMPINLLNQIQNSNNCNDIDERETSPLLTEDMNIIGNNTYANTNNTTTINTGQTELFNDNDII